MVIERMICLSNGSTAQPVVMRQNDYNTAEIRLIVYETPDHLLDMTGMAAVVIYEVAGVPTDPYEATVEESHCLRFVVPGEVTETHGNGRMQIGIYLENSLTHSYMLPYEVEYSLPMPGPGTEADPAPAFFALVKEARETMANVKDGGYYTPNVDGTGNLSWVGSDSDMPVLPTVNIMGPKGDDGQKGDAGSTPIINENGNWELDGADTGVKADWSEEQTNAATSAAAAAKSAENAAASADDAAESARLAAESAEEAAGSLGELNAKKEAAIDEIQAAGDRTLDSIPQDYTSLVTEVAGMANAIVVDDLDPANVVHVTNAAARPAVELVTFIEPYQAGSGDSSPDNVRAISGWDTLETTGTAKNILSPLHKGVRIEASTGAEIVDAKYSATPFARYDGVSTLFLSGIPATLSNFVAFYDANKMFVGRTSAQAIATRSINPNLTLHNSRKANEARYIRLSVYQTSSSVGTIDDVDAAQIQMERGTVATDYEPYQGQTLTAKLPETVYGGSRNWTTGVLTVTKAKYVFDGTTDIDWGINSNGIPYIRTSNSVGGVHGTLDMICNQYKNVTTTVKDKSIRCISNKLYIYDSLYTDEATAISMITANPVEIVFPLTTPYTIQLTPQQLNLLNGTNNVWSNCGETKLVYVADTKKYIDEKFAALAAAQLGV